MSAMPRRDPLWDYCRLHDLLAPGRAVLVGVSGGPDSLCLLDRLHRLAALHAFPLAVAHFDHSLRSDSAEDAAFVRADSERRGLPFYAERADTAAYASEHKLSIEAAARARRYDFLARAARQAGMSYIAVAHTQDDQAETVLMHFLRGSGVAGLSGMQPRVVLPAHPAPDWAEAMLTGERGLETGDLPGDHPLILIRPLLGISRAQVEQYCAEHGLQPRCDPSNVDRRYTRNRVRHDLLPGLERENPNLRETLARNAELLGMQRAQLAQHVTRLWGLTAPAAEQTPGQAARLDRAALLRLSPADQLAMLRQGAAQVLGDDRELGLEPFQAARRFAETAAPGRGCAIVRGVRLKIERDRLVLFRGADPLPDYPLLLDAAGRLPADCRLVAEPVEADSRSAHQKDRWEVEVSTEALAGPLAVRARRRGERFQPVGMGGRSVKLSDFFINLRIAAVARVRWPLVVCGDAVVWVAGLRLDERFAVRSAGAPRTRLRFARVGPSQLQLES
ncbi:MAG: tRNA lysidine(34) synthetase TilS [Anaerolineales bacterium]|nr:tRNA lysidine(34) synthetase TilS [Anaerolineales bacterium]